MSGTPLSVTHVTMLVRGAIGSTPELEDLLVEGEVSNLSRPGSGHLYFTVKDASSTLRCVCFRGTLAHIPFRPEHGMAVILHGRVDVYDQGGTYQLYVDRIEPSGVGALALAVEQRKRELAAEGVFEERLKRALPRLPRRIVVVTSVTSAALRDVCTVVRRRAPTIDIVVAPAQVQGADAVPTLLAALTAAQTVRDADVVLIVRGGGSLVDLMSFNDAALARAIRHSRLPVVVGVGHETDTTIADLAADRRAPTPSAAAELAVPALSQLHDELGQRSIRIGQAVRAAMTGRRAVVARGIARLDALSPRRRLSGLRQDLDARTARLRAAARSELHEKRRRWERARFGLDAASPARRIELLRAGVGARGQRLAALSPFAVLTRGYSITTDAATGKVVSAATAAPGQHLRTRVADGSIESTVSATEDEARG